MKLHVTLDRLWEFSHAVDTMLLILEVLFSHDSRVAMMMPAP